MICKTCDKDKPVDRFEIIKHSGNRRRTCRDCIYDRKKQSPTFAERNRQSTIKHRYGITAEQYDALLTAQGGVCRICGEAEARKGKPNLAVDHDHACCPGRSSCGKCIRGLLCRPCNAGIGYLRDDPERLRQAIIYLEGE